MWNLHIPMYCNSSRYISLYFYVFNKLDNSLIITKQYEIVLGGDNASVSSGTASDNDNNITNLNNNNDNLIQFCFYEKE